MNKKLSKSINIIKGNQYTIDEEAFTALEIPHHMPYTSIIKRFQIDYSYAEKYKLGIITFDEFQIWQAELAKEREGQAEEGDYLDELINGAVSQKNHTFWENDTSDRLNVSSDAYGEFLLANNLDVSNVNAVDFDALAKQQETKPPVEEEVDLDAILAAAVPMGSNTGTESMLSQAEIDALFASAFS